jgi:hypothetical protein
MQITKYRGGDSIHSIGGQSCRCTVDGEAEMVEVDSGGDRQKEPQEWTEGSSRMQIPMRM